MLKSKFSPLHGQPKGVKQSVPRDLDGAYRIYGRLDEIPVNRVVEIALSDGKED